MENNEKAAETTIPDTVETVTNPWYQGQISLEEAKAFIKSNMLTAARSFIAIGFYLKRVRDQELYLEDGYLNIWDFTKAEYGLSKSTASRYMSINDRFSVGGNSPIIQEQYQDFDKSKLQEMLYLEDDQLKEVRPEQSVKEIRNLRKEMPYIEIPGQVNITDFPEFLPDSYFQTAPVPVPQEIVQSQPFTLNVSDMLADQSVATSQQVEVPTIETRPYPREMPNDMWQESECIQENENTDPEWECKHKEQLIRAREDRKKHSEANVKPYVYPLLWIRDKETGETHLYGTNTHDSLHIDDDGGIHYYNLQNGDGTGNGCGYEFVDHDPDGMMYGQILHYYLESGTVG